MARLETIKVLVPIETSYDDYAMDTVGFIVPVDFDYKQTKSNFINGSLIKSANPHWFKKDETLSDRYKKQANKLWMQFFMQMEEVQAIDLIEINE